MPLPMKNYSNDELARRIRYIKKSTEEAVVPKAPVVPEVTQEVSAPEVVLSEATATPEVTAYEATPETVLPENPVIPESTSEETAEVRTEPEADKSVLELGLSPRAEKHLLKAGLYTVGKVRAYLKTHSLQELHGIGDKAAEEIMTALNEGDR